MKLGVCMHVCMAYTLYSKKNFYNGIKREKKRVRGPSPSKNMIQFYTAWMKYNTRNVFNRRISIYNKKITRWITVCQSNDCATPQVFMYFITFHFKISNNMKKKHDLCVCVCVYIRCTHLHFTHHDELPIFNELAPFSALNFTHPHQLVTSH